MGVQVKLTEEEIVEAIFEYVESKYPTMYGEKVTLNYPKGRLKEAIVDCKFRTNAEKKL